MIKWTKENENLLKENWQHHSDEELAMMFDTTIEAIKTKRRRLRLIRKEKKIHNTVKWIFDDVKMEFEKANLTLLETQYKDYTTKMNYVCNKHKEFGVQQISFCDLLRGRSCFYCGREKTMSFRRVSEKTMRTECEKRSLIYQGYKRKDEQLYVQFLCPNHLQYGIQQKTFSNLKKCSGCPHCKQSHGEKAVGDFLLSHNIKFETEKTFPDCKYKYVLRFDFYLPDYNMIIEFDGEQHFSPIPLRLQHSKMTEEIKKRVEDNFILNKKKDKIKDDYCKNKGIILLRIPYWELNNIENYIQSHCPFLEAG